MSWRRTLFCDECDTEIPVWKWNIYGSTPDIYLVGHTHMCEECQRKKLGYFLGDKNEFPFN